MPFIYILFLIVSSHFTFPALAENLTVVTPEECFAFSKESKTIYRYLCIDRKNVVIPDTIQGLPVEIIGDHSFDGMQIESVHIPSYVKIIANFAFIHNKIKSLIIPGNVQVIGVASFQDNQLTSLVIHNGLKKLFGNAFRENLLTFVQIPYDLDYRLGGSPQLEFDLNVQVVRTTNPAVYQSPSENTPETCFDFDPTEQAIILYKCELFTHIVIPSSIDGVTVKKIGGGNKSVFSDAFFFGNENGSIKIPNTVTIIESHAFKSADTPVVEIPDSVTEIKDHAFLACRLKSLTLPKRLERIGAWAFASNRFTQLAIPFGIEVISESAFAGTQLRSIQIPDSVKEIQDRAFYDTHISSVKIPKQTKLGRDSFDPTVRIKRKRK